MPERKSHAADEVTHRYRFNVAHTTVAVVIKSKFTFESKTVAVVTTRL